MFYLDFHNEFYTKELISLLNQKNIPFTDNSSKNVFGKISLSLGQNNLTIYYGNYKVNLIHPLTFEKFLAALLEVSSNINIKHKKLIYFPIKHSVNFQKKNLILKDTHNLIFQKLILNLNGINKLSLYKFLWPNDKDIHMNKLDTHLTNLKSNFLENLEYKLKFSSSAGILKLII